MTSPHNPPATPAPAARILVVEDERIVAMNLQSKLESMGYHVPAAVASGEDAVARAGELKPDLVLMDIRLEGAMDGVEAARLIRERWKIPVVYLTAYSNPDIVERAKLTQPFGYILKPFVDRELQVVIEVALHRHRMERALLEQKRLLDATLRSIGDAVITTDQDQRITFLNPVAERLTGWQQEEAVGRPLPEVFRIVNELTQLPVQSPLDKALRNRAPVPLANQTALITKANTQIPIDDSAAPILDDLGEVRGGVLVFRDVTARRAALRAMAKLAAIIAASEDAILSVSRDGRIASWNPAAERLFGYPARDAIGQHDHRLAAAERVAEVQTVLDKLQGGESVPPYETVRRRQDGTEVEVLITVSPLKDEDDDVVGVACIMRDLTQLRRLEQQFRQAQKMEAIGRLAGGVAHDFNNLLTIINGYTSIVLSDLHPHDRHRGDLDHVLRAGERAAALTQQLLAYSRRQMLKPQVMNLNDLLARTEKMLRPMIGEDIELVFNPGPDLRWVKIDPTHMEQVVLNLAANARDAMPRGGTLTIETANMTLAEAAPGTPAEVQPGPYVQLTIQDTGTGMDKVTLTRLFEPFFTTKELGKGTGLGLATVYGIIKQSGGHIAVESQPGAGTQFHIYLPSIEAAPAEPPRQAPAGITGGTETILIVEDEEGVRNLTARMLEQCGYAVLTVPDGQQALETLAQRRNRIDLLVTDVVMPRMSGTQLAEFVRMRHPGVKILFQSGYNDDAVLGHLVGSSDRNFIQKPFTMRELAGKVRGILDEK